VTVVVSPPAVRMPLVSSTLGRVDGETEHTEGVDIEGGNLRAQEGKTIVFAEVVWRQNIPPPKCWNV